jgi:hypothetical protein
MDEHIEASVAAIADRQHGVLSSSQAQRCGLTRGMIGARLRSGRWERTGDGIYRVGGAPSTWRQRLWIALLDAGPTAVLSHRSAAALRRLRGYREGPIEVTKRSRLDHRISSGVRHESKRLPIHHTEVVDGFPCTTLARTVFDLCAGEHPKRAARIVDNAIVDDGLAIEQLDEVLGDLAKRGRNGVRLVRSIVVKRMDDPIPVESANEQRFLDLIEAAGLPAPERQLELGDDLPIGRVDFGYRELGLLFEIDGRAFHTSLSDREADRERDNRLMAAGWRVLRITDEELWQRPDQVVAIVRRALTNARRAAREQRSAPHPTVLTAELHLPGAHLPPVGEERPPARF